MQNNQSQVSAKEKSSHSKFIKGGKNFPHPQDEQSEEQGQKASSNKGTAAVSSALIGEAAGFAPKILDEIIEKLEERFGEEKVQKWTALLGGEGAGSEGAFFNILRAAIPSIPQDMSLANISQLADWEPIKERIQKKPVATAATVVAGLGALFVAREYLKSEGQMSFSSLVPKKALNTMKNMKSMKLTGGKSKSSSASKSKSSSQKSTSKSKKR